MPISPEPYTTIDEWAASRGRQIRAYFGFANDPFAPNDPNIPPKLVPGAAWNNTKVLTLQLDFRERFAAFLDVVEQLGASRDVEFIVWDAGRTLERHLNLYKRGRVPSLDTKKQVTWTIASNHLWGCAIDLALRGKTLSATNKAVSFDLPKWYERDVLPLARPFGLDSLYLKVGKDLPHFEVPVREQPESVRAWAKGLKADFPGV